MNKWFTVLGGNFKLSAQDSDLEYLVWKSKNSPVSYDSNPSLEFGNLEKFRNDFVGWFKNPVSSQTGKLIESDWLKCLLFFCFFITKQSETFDYLTSIF